MKLTPLAGTKVNFDFGADGFAEQTGWVSAQDGLVVLDRNKNGKIDNGTELFGNATEDGFAALAKFDLNKDGMIDSKDSVFKDLRIWRDANGNGVTDTGELLTFAQAGIKNIKLAKKAAGTDNQGNTIDYTGTFTRSDNKAGQAAAVSFAVNQTLTQWAPPSGFTPSEAAQKLPILKGYGRLKDFVASATASPALLKQAQDLVTGASGTMNGAQIVAAFDALLFAWAGVDKLDPKSRGQLVDARELGFMAAFYNDGFYDSGEIASQGQANLDNTTYDQLRNALLTRFLAGIPLSIWKMTGDETQTFGNRFLPLLQLGLADDNQYYGDLRTAMFDFFAAMPRDAAGEAAYANLIRIALSGAQLDFALSDDDFTSMLLGGVTKRWTAFADITREANYFGSMSFVSSVKNGTFTDTSANENIVWSGGNLTITETGGYDRLILPGVVLARISWRVVGSNVTLIIAPSAAGKADGGTIAFPPDGLNAVVLADGNAVLSEDIKTAALSPMGTAASEKIVGSSIYQFWNDTITGGGGNDTLEGGDGDDIFVWNFGDGQDVVDGGRLTNDTIRFGIGIAKTHLSCKVVGNDVLLTIAPSAAGVTNGGSILLKNQTVTGGRLKHLLLPMERR